MSFFKKLFGKKDPVDEMRQLLARQDWAGVLIVAKQVDRSTLDEELRAEVEGWEHQAGDTLAGVNLEEGSWALKSGNLLRARDDFQLALEQARSPELRKRAEQALATLERGGHPALTISTQADSAGHAGCGTCQTPSTDKFAKAPQDLDDDARVEVLLAALPPELAERYSAAGETLQQAWLAAQDGDDRRAMKLLEQVPQAERDVLYLYERGSLQARSNRHQQAREDLRAALAVEPDFFPAFAALVENLAGTGRLDAMAGLLKEQIAAGRFAGYCWARLAELHAQRGEAEAALAAGLKGLEEGANDAALLVLCSQLLESSERFNEAEALLKRLPAGGCGGGAHPMLAEFWLRRGQNLNRALESFKGALRQERDNPRWLLRIAQVYSGKGWRKEATEQIERLMRQGELPEQIRSEVKALVDQLQKS